MVCFKLLRNEVYVLGFTIFSFGLIFQAQADSKIEEIEKAILAYYKYTGGFVWKWNSKEAKRASIDGSNKHSKYDVLCPPGTAAYVLDDFPVQNIMLESQSCTKVQMEILKCQCSRKQRDEDGIEVIHNTNFRFVRGPNGEVYEVLPPEDEIKCNDPRSRIIKRCVHPGDFFILDMSEVEKLIASRESQGETVEWVSPESTCKLLHPHSSKIRIERLPVKLESENCVEVRMPVLKCIYMKVGNEESPVEYKGQMGYVKDIDNQVYEVQYPLSNTKCGMGEIYTIRKRVIDSQNRLVQLVCPK